MTDVPPEHFICIDCGIEVYWFGPPHANDQHLCAECTFLRTIEDPVEREAVRQHLQKGRL